MLIPNKYDGYSRDGRRLYYFGGDDGGGAAAPSDKQTNITELPEWARGYAKRALQRGEALTDITQNPYQTYGANRIAGFSPMQQRSMQAAAYMRPSEQLGTATDLASAAGIGALGINYQPGQFSNQFTAPDQYQSGQFTMERAQGPGLQNYQMTGPADVQSQQFGKQAADQYMSPYMQNVVDVQQREAQRQADITGTQRNAQAAQAGAFGGSRQAIMNAEAARNLATQKGGIQAQGLQSSFEQAQRQYNADQAQRMQAALANQGMGYNVGAQNLQANLGVQQLGAGQNLQAQLANQAVNQQTQQAREQSRQYGAGLDMTSAQQRAQYGQAAQQLGEQSRQFGANLGLQGLQTALQGAGQLGQLGGQQFQQGMDINKLQNVYGGQMQQQAQRPLDQAYQDFQNQQNYPYKQLGFMSDMIRGLPLGQQSTSAMYQSPGSMLGQLGGLGMGAYGISQLMKADGGMVHDYAEGGVTSDQNVEGILSKLSDQQLQQAKQGALARRDVEQANMIDAEMAMRASARNGIGAGISPEFADQMEEGMASGGIVAFADRGAVKEMPEKATSSIGDFLNSIGVNDAVNSLRESYYKTKEGVQRMERAEDVLPGPFESMTPSERASRKAAGTELFKGPKSVAKMSPAEIEAAAAATMGPTSKPSKSSNALTAAEIESRNAAIMGGSDVDKAGNITQPKTPSTQTATKKPEGLFSGSKPSKAEVKSAVAQFAEQQGVTKGEKDDYMTMALKLRDELGKQDQPILDKLNAAIEAQKPNEQAIKDRGIAQAIAQFGFGMAERAAKPGARFLESASGASPILASVADKTNSLIDAKKENYTKMQLDQAKYEMALSQGKMQTAATLAGNIRQSQQQDKLLDFNIAKAKDELALKNRELAQSGAYQNQMASRYETIGSLTRDIMQNEGLPYDKALEKAGRLMKPAGYAADVRANTALNANLDKALKDIDAKDKYRFLSILKPDNPRYGPMKAEYDAEVRAAHARYGDGGGQPNPPKISMAQKGFKVLGTE